MLHSPLPYMGNKYNLLPQLLPLFPRSCDIFVDGFGGSRVVSLNYKGTKQTIYNEFNPNIVNILKCLLENDANSLDKYFNIYIDRFGLPTKGLNTREEYLKYQPNYNQLRNYYNTCNRDIRLLYLLIRYSINNLIRFNKNDEFNAPSGKQVYNKKVLSTIQTFQKNFKEVTILNKNFFNLDLSILTKDSFVYLDVPYTNTKAVYNESRAYGGRSLEEDKKLFVLLEELDRRGIKWGLSNVFTNNGISNNHLIQWCDKHGRKVYHLSITYTPFSKAKNENKTDEVFICNYCNSYELW